MLIHSGLFAPSGVADATVPVAATSVVVRVEVQSSTSIGTVSIHRADAA